MKEILKRKVIPAFLAATLLTGGIAGDVLSKPWDFDTSDHKSAILKSIQIPNGNKTVTLTLRDTDVKQVLRMFADKAGLNIIFHDSVGGTVTMDLVNISLDDAFKMIIETMNLAYLQDDDTLIIMSSDIAKSSNIAKREMKIVPVKYTEASAVATFLNKNIFGLNKPGLSNGEIVVTNPIKNEVLIFGTENDYKMAKSVIEKIDIKPNSTTYKVNHVTPKEMAALICESLFTTTADGGTTKLAGTFTGGADGLELGGGTVACKSPNKVSGSVLESFGSGSLTVIYHTGLGTINIMGGSNEQIQLINEFITMHDRKQPQAVLEFLVLSLNEEGTKEFNNNWVFANNTYPVNFTNGALTLGKLIFFGNDRGVTGTSNHAGGPALSDVITWVESQKKGRVLQKPKIIVTNGKQSTIDMTQDFIEKTDSQMTTSLTGGNPITTRTYTIGKDQGMKMGITPFISPDGYVTMNITADYSQPYSFEENVDALGNKYRAVTLLERRNLNLNTVRVKNGETLIIGGLIREDESQVVSKVPILGDIPGLGVFFRNTKTERKKNELVILITPRLIADTEDAIDI